MKARLPRNLAETCVLFAGWSIFVAAIILLGWLRGEPLGSATVMLKRPSWPGSWSRESRCSFGARVGHGPQRHDLAERVLPMTNKNRPDGRGADQRRRGGRYGTLSAIHRRRLARLTPFRRAASATGCWQEVKTPRPAEGVAKIASGLGFVSEALGKVEISMVVIAAFEQAVMVAAS
jgi:hypothetical protein